MANQKISARTVLTGTGLISTPVARAGSTTNYRVVHNLSATTNPGVGDDSGDGYHAASMWFRTDTGALFVCLDASLGAAVWRAIGYGEASAYIANNWYLPEGVGPNGGAAPGLDTIRAYPIRVKQRVTISDLQGRLSSGNGAHNAQFAIYAHNPTTGRPTGNALGKTGNLSLAATGNIAGTLDVAAVLLPSRFVSGWLAVNTSNAAPNFVAVSSNAPTEFAAGIGTATAANIFTSASTMLNHVSVSQTFGTWPDLTSGSFTEVATSTAPLLAFKVSAVG